MKCIEETETTSTVLADGESHHYQVSYKHLSEQSLLLYVGQVDQVKTGLNA